MTLILAAAGLLSILVKEEKITDKDLSKLIKQRLKNTIKESIVKDLWYVHKKKGLKRLNALIKADNIEAWVRKGGYDFLYSNKSFSMILCEALDFDEADFFEIFKKANDKINAINKMPTPYIFINTNFYRQEQPVFLLAFLEKTRRIYIDKLEVFDSSDNGLSLAKQTTKEHYQKTKGILKIWGKIDNYIYHANNKKYIINKDGETEDNRKQIFESKATVSI